MSRPRHRVNYDDGTNWPCWCGIGSDHDEEFMMPCGRTIHGLEDSLSHADVCADCLSITAPALVSGVGQNKGEDKP